ncbi:related to phytanoyl-CoA dioxygenase family protein [Armillaria ostoyae]|uniref:Related to phytanoyl-CoA dioxygenase family protein n=1 Tax=Armillaria ostoyae TaxID=47428 RepID=A0A284RCR9_ARMOS|nr:related to phytanoyl-CoA dioxygenase family protein [Armillaria ostoyae]
MSALKNQFTSQGFVIVPDLVSPSDLTLLRTACEDVVERTRSGRWSLRRTVGKQFPPYDADDDDSWGVQMLMHPELGHPIFAEWYTSDALTSVVKELLGCEEEVLQMELFNLLINPISHDFALRWHRDDVKGDASLVEEKAALALWNHGIQWNTALYEDACLYVVPGSHSVPRTPEQRMHSTTMDAPADPLDMPGAIPVVLKPGDTVFYNNNILHLGTYSAKAKRATLHASMGDVRGGSVRARNVLQHGLGWMKEDTFRDGLSVKGKAMLDRLIEMQKKNEGIPIGYSLDN